MKTEPVPICFFNTKNQNFRKLPKFSCTTLLNRLCSPYHWEFSCFLHCQSNPIYILLYYSFQCVPKLGSKKCLHNDVVELLTILESPILYKIRFNWIMPIDCMIQNSAGRVKHVAVVWETRPHFYNFNELASVPAPVTCFLFTVKILCWGFTVCTDAYSKLMLYGAAAPALMQMLLRGC